MQKMKKGKNKSQVSMTVLEHIPEPDPQLLDSITVKIKSLRVTDENPMPFTVNVTFYDQLILTGVMNSTLARASAKEKTVLVGTMYYDPSDYERMCIIAGSPLCVQIQPLTMTSPSPSASPGSSVNKGQTSQAFKKLPSIVEQNLRDISCCNIDVLPLFIDKNKKHLKKRMQPRIKPPSVLFCKSWDNLPLLNLKLEVTRNPLNEQHHNVLKNANWMQLTLIGAYNMLVPYGDEFVYTAATKLPLQSDTELGLVTFGQGRRLPKRFSSLSFNPKWECLRIGDRNFTNGEAKFETSLEEIQNDDDIPIKKYLDKPTTNTVIWGSFHRTLMLRNADTRLCKDIRRYHWPLEVHIYGETQGYSFMAFINLFKLLYPGENTVCIAVPLQWINAEAMQQMCGCELLLTPNDKASSTFTAKTTRTEPRGPTCSLETASFTRATGFDDNNAFVMVEVKLARPLRKVVIPPYISPAELNDMLDQLEHAAPHKRECTGRGQLDRDWKTTVRNAANALRKVPYYGSTEFCQFNRQLSETRTRVELTTSCWQDAAVYINNNFVVENFLQSEETFEEMLMMSHACLMKNASVTLVGKDSRLDTDTTLRAARHARQMHDILHATDLYLQVVAQRPRDADCWRELSTCFKDVDRDTAIVCINKSVVLDPRHPLSLLSKGCMLAEGDPDMAEPFFEALIALYPFWSLGWIITNAYYMQRELYLIADQVLEHNTKSLFYLSNAQNFDSPRTWESELGDWWDTAPLLSGMSPYYSAADFLLRLRCVKMAEVCVSLALCESGETAVYYHLVALCCRLQDNIEDALCHVRAGIAKYGEISYLRSLEAECYHKMNDITAATASFEKAGNCTGSYCILLSTPCREQIRIRTILVDLSRRQPSAYAWIALADDWMMVSVLLTSTRAAAGEASEAESSGQSAPAAAKTCAAMCTIQALKWDRRAGKAWALLAKLVKPSARRLHCMQMAWECGYRYSTSDKKLETAVESEQSLCHRLGIALKECQCHLCEKTKI